MSFGRCWLWWSPTQVLTFVAILKITVINHDKLPFSVLQCCRSGSELARVGPLLSVSWGQPQGVAQLGPWRRLRKNRLPCSVLSGTNWILSRANYVFLTWPHCHATGLILGVCTSYLSGYCDKHSWKNEEMSMFTDWGCSPSWQGRHCGKNVRQLVTWHP